MKLKAIVGALSVVASCAVIATPANAEGQVRGGITSIKSVASTLAGQTRYSNFKWAEGRAVSAASDVETGSGDNFKWASRPAEEAFQAASVESGDAVEARHRWGIKADATQTRHRWGIKADAVQTRHRWGIKADAEQARHRWGIKADATQTRHRWGIK